MIIDDHHHRRRLLIQHTRYPMPIKCVHVHTNPLQNTMNFGGVCEKDSIHKIVTHHRILEQKHSTTHAPPPYISHTYLFDLMRFIGVDFSRVPNWCAEFAKRAPQYSTALYDSNTSARASERTRLHAHANTDQGAPSL